MWRPDSLSGTGEGRSLGTIGACMGAAASSGAATAKLGVAGSAAMVTDVVVMSPMAATAETSLDAIELSGPSTHGADTLRTPCAIRRPLTTISHIRAQTS